MGAGDNEIVIANRTDRSPPALTIASIFQIY